MTACIGEPVSYLRLERFELHELPAEEQRSVADHLAQCATCRACYERIHADAREVELAELAGKLPPLSASALQPRAAGRARGARDHVDRGAEKARGGVRPRARAAWLWGGSVLALSLVALLAVLRAPEGLQPMAPGGVKGAELAIELIRVGAEGEQPLDPSRFAPGDRFRIALSCPPALAGKVRMLVFQAGERFEPLPAQTLASCGNRRMLQGAFRLDGDAPVDVCVVLGDADLSAASAREALPEPHVCAQIER